MAPQGKILIVEDDEVTRKNLSRLLNRDGWTTTFERKDAPSGDERGAFVIGMGRSREKE